MSVSTARARVVIALISALAATSACERGNAASPTNLDESALPQFTVTAAASSAIAPRGWNALVSLSIGRRDSFKSAVQLSVDGLPRGVTGTFTTSNITSEISGTKLNIEADSTAAFGTFPVTIRAASGSVVATTTISIVVPKPSFQLSSSPTVTLNSSGPLGGQVVLTATRDYFWRAPITFTVSDVPTGVQLGTKGVIGSDESAVLVSFVRQAGAAPGSYLITIRAHGADADDRETTTTLTIVP